MARNRTPQTFEKRRREMDKQTKHNAKIERRHARKAAKRELAANPPAPVADLSEAVPAPAAAPPAPAAAPPAPAAAPPAPAPPPLPSSSPLSSPHAYAADRANALISNKPL